MNFEKLISVDEIVKLLRNPLIRLSFSISIVGIIKIHVPQNFQSSGDVITEVHEKMSVFFKKILLDYLDHRYVEQTDLNSINFRNE